MLLKPNSKHYLPPESPDFHQRRIGISCFRLIYAIQTSPQQAHPNKVLRSGREVSGGGYILVGVFGFVWGRKI
ncbi:MAG: hypothetical protein A2776_00860 [Candidatus Levybacteria bacterium RIFCSPHIGHO2_01_FULL_40_10]|nr:MAG: hypothetical protein A2776_00860 [Candidatus Levybacteria bacterium RIFCSPHIGHO2_01_FULL_40_10]